MNRNKTFEGSSAIADYVRTSLSAVVARYDTLKYPEHVYDKLREVFSVASGICDVDIRGALEWKFGHTGKSNYPERHKLQIVRVSRLWESTNWPSIATPEALFERLRSGGERFITAAFL